jgi:transketolase
MLNKYLKLNEKLFDADVEQKATRDGFGEALVELGENNPNVVVLTADVSESTRVDGFARKFPERFFQVGVAEQNLASIAAGLSVTNKTAFISAYAAFSPGKNWETIKTTIIYNQANVKIAGHHAGIVTGPDGVTHQAVEDLALTRTLPGLTVFVPCDAIEAKNVTLEAANIQGPVYLRFSREKTPVITTSETPFDKNKIFEYWISDNPKATIFATGHMLYQALIAARNLESEGINVIVANVSVIKPTDVNSVIELTKKSGKVVTAEDHQIAGGMGSMIAEVLAKNFPMPVEFVGLQDTFAESGNAKELLEKYQMNYKAIMEAIKKVITR